MPVEKIFSAFILGISWDRILCCPFLAMSLSLSDRMAGLKFITGRLLGVVLLGLIATWIGVPFHPPESLINTVFGIFLIGLGISIFLKTEHKGPKKQFSRVGFGLGLFRGLLNPGRKIIYLLPLLWGTGLSEGAAISFVYALSSSVYLAIGFFSAEALNKLFAYRRTIKIIGGMALILLGLFDILKQFIFKGG